LEFFARAVAAVVPEDAALIEYYSTGEQLIAGGGTRGNIEIIPVRCSRVLLSCNLFRFQISKISKGAAYAQKFERPMLQATQSHCKRLYAS